MDFEEQKQLDERNEKIGNLLIKLKKINKVYQVCTEEQRGRLLENSQFIFDQLVEFGYERIFVETLLIGGDDFVESCVNNGIDLYLWGNVRMIFG